MRQSRSVARRGPRTPRRGSRRARLGERVGEQIQGSQVWDEFLVRGREGVLFHRRDPRLCGYRAPTTRRTSPHYGSVAQGWGSPLPTPSRHMKQPGVVGIIPEPNPPISLRSLLPRWLSRRLRHGLRRSDHSSLRSRRPWRHRRRREHRLLGRFDVNQKHPQGWRRPHDTGAGAASVVARARHLLRLLGHGLRDLRNTEERRQHGDAGSGAGHAEYRGRCRVRVLGRRLRSHTANDEGPEGWRHRYPVDERWCSSNRDRLGVSLFR